MDLDGSTALVTGANRGIGRYITEQLAHAGVRVLAGVRDLDRWTPIDGAPGVRAVQMDLGSRASIEAGCDALGDELDGLDLLVHNAGRFTAGLLERQDLDAIYDLVQVNLLGTIHLTQRVLPAMLRRGAGKIVISSSVVGYVHFPAVSTYSASKAGVAGFAESLRRELAPTPVTTLHVVTGGIDTDMLDETKAQLSEHFGSTDGWDQHSPQEWGARIVKAIADDDEVLGPGGKAALGKLASHLPKAVLDTVVARAFER
jgi:NAD(P)-dependent dehydrogenase (short-subunit alcohol dehydrogenase family)